MVLGLRQQGVIFDLFAFASALATVYVGLIVREQDSSHVEGSWLLAKLRADIDRLQA